MEHIEEPNVQPFMSCKHPEHWENQIIFGKCEQCGKEIIIKGKYYGVPVMEDENDAEEITGEDMNFAPEEDQVSEASEKAFTP